MEIFMPLMAAGPSQKFSGYDQTIIYYVVDNLDHLPLKLPNAISL